ncbi:MAG: DUF3789 domain-containing protein [Clostridiales bacterium]|nr:DUF3789 domain-containing protein [Clostridiales bacterium]
MLTHFIVFCAGGFVGVLTACMCIAAGEADRRNKNYDEKGDEKE